VTSAEVRTEHHLGIKYGDQAVEVAVPCGGKESGGPYFAFGCLAWLRPPFAPARTWPLIGQSAGEHGRTSSPVS